MSWYYAGPEAKPVGPVSLEELQARRASGQITADTYVIEQTGQPGLAWRRYREVFTQSVTPPSLPPLPVAPPAPVLPPILPTTAPVPPTPSPLFPSAAAPNLPPPQPMQPPPPVYTPSIAPHAAPHGHYPTRVTNSLCAWGFGLAIAGFVLAFACGVGLLLAAPALLLCIIGFVQVQQRREQSGSGLAVAGAILSILALLISIAFLAWAIPAGIKEHEDSVKEEQNSQ